MRNFGLILVLALAIPAAGVFAQAKGGKAPDPQMALGLDIAPLMKGIVASDKDSKNSYFALGLTFERMIKAPYALTIRADLIAGSTMDQDYFYLDIMANLRWYLSKQLDKFFLEAGLGFSTETFSELDAVTGLIYGMKAGYKMSFTPKIFAELAMGYIIGETSRYGPVPLGWQPSIALGLKF